MKKFSRGAVAINLAVAVNLALIGALALLNHEQDVPRKHEPKVTLAVLDDFEDQTAPAQQAFNPEPLFLVDPEPITIELDFPEPHVQPIRRESIGLELSEPDFGTVRIVPQPGPKQQPVEGNGAPPPMTDQARNADGVTDPPRDLANKPPRYPESARRQKAEGSARTKMLIDERGRVAAAEIIRSVGHPSFPDAVLKAVRRWRFTPPRHHGRPVRVWGVREVEFKLDR